MQFDLKCQFHPKYQAVNYPRADCEACRVLYWFKKDGVLYFADNARLVVIGKYPKKPIKTS